MSQRQSFETLVLPHLDAAYNLARWLLRNDQAAEDAVQEASMRALRYIDALRGDDARPWLLGIVRNTCFTMLERARNGPQVVDFDDAEFEAALGEAQRGGHRAPHEMPALHHHARTTGISVTLISVPVLSASISRQPSPL